MAGDYKKLLNKKRKREYANVKTMGVNIDKNEYYEIILSNSAHPERVNDRHPPLTTAGTHSHEHFRRGPPW